ncbi:MAG: hypothetical protein LBQ36_08375 [Synergistaceae bacterium]|nr:hypothetical protein [Synergistaceae bacterium]
MNYASQILWLVVFFTVHFFGCVDRRVQGAFNLLIMNKTLCHRKPLAKWYKYFLPPDYRS